MKIGIILSGCGVYDGSEIQEAVFTLLEISKSGAEAVCFAPNVNQHHVINHTTGQEMSETRNVLIESARIARGAISDVAKLNVSDLDALILPGGFGAAKNLTKWAFEGPAGDIHPDVSAAVQAMLKAGKPVGALCMAPVVLAKAMEGSGKQVILTVGTSEEPSPYDINAIGEGINATGAIFKPASIREVQVDVQNKIVTAPCYMMEGSVAEVYENVAMLVKEVVKMVKEN